MPDWVTISAVLVIGGIIFAFGKWYGSVNSDRKFFKEFMSEIRKDIKEIRTNIEEIFRRLPVRPLITAKSPLSLTEFGEIVAEELDAEDWADNLAYEVWENVQGMKDYEVHEYCFDNVRTDDFTGYIRDTIKEVAYENGINTDGVYDVLAIVLRDTILEKLQEGEGLSTTE